MELAIFITSAIVIAFAGTRLSMTADRLADRTAVGEALVGGILLGASTSISGSVLSVVAAYDGYTELAIGNAIGGIAVQTFFLCLADIFYKRANLEHAAVSSTNILLGCLLLALLSIPLIIQGSPEWTILGIHPITPIMFIVYGWGIHFASKEKENPMWRPHLTKETVEDIPDEPKGGKKTLKKLWLEFFILAILLTITGVAIKTSGVSLAEKWGLNHIILGTILTATITSLPELITTFAAVRRGALTLAVGGIVGGNTFDVLFLAFSDIAYREGSIYHKITSNQIAFIGITMLMIAVLLMGLIRREKSGIANIGSESVLIGVLYICSVFLLFS